MKVYANVTDNWLALYDSKHAAIRRRSRATKYIMVAKPCEVSELDEIARGRKLVWQNITPSEAGYTHTSMSTPARVYGDFSETDCPFRVGDIVRALPDNDSDWSEVNTVGTYRVTRVQRNSTRTTPSPGLVFEIFLTADEGVPAAFYTQRANESSIELVRL